MRRSLLALLLALVPVPAMADLLKPGDAFPAWTLTDDTGASVSSASLAGKTYLLWFYPKAMTPGCTAEGNGLKQLYPAFQAKGVEIFGVSFDPPEQNAAFVAEEEFPFRLLSDGDRTLAAQVGAASSREQAAAARISYLVGPDGKVKRAYGSVDPRRHAEQVLGDVP